eukprot:GHVP01048118.1.p1 GENE.GHVP01048118.1~~GHVP01048118.1.p1  ORF type:complete len:120 (+),score=14.06 GHVP01048118.1:161-520(+)
MNSNKSFLISDTNILQNPRRAAKTTNAATNKPLKKGGANTTTSSSLNTATLSGQRRNSLSSRLAPSPPSGRSGGLYRTPPRQISSASQINHSPRPKHQIFHSPPKASAIPIPIKCSRMT